MTEQVDSTAIDTLEPAIVWRLFAEIASVPRPSKREARIREHVRTFAGQNGFAVREDQKGNLVVEVPASPGRQDAPITVLQGHLDMVCEKNADTRHDFDRDAIRLVVDTEAGTGEPMVRADGTTLGADNGIGLAMGFAAAVSPDVIHGPLELLCTVDEEDGMTGAKALTPGSFRGRRMLNLDSEEDDTIYIGCAGGCDVTLTWNPVGEARGGDDEVGRVVVAGLRGGHSGGDIHEGRGNAIKLLARTLLRANCDTLKIAGLSGGSKRNVIPREATALVCGPPRAIRALEAAAREVTGEGVRESAEQDLLIRVEAVSPGDVTRVLSAEDTERLLAVLAALPHGVLGMHPTVEGLVETSNNLATISVHAIDDDRALRVEVGSLARSSSDSRMQETLAQIAAVGRLAGAAVETANDYPGWEPNVNSPLLGTCRRLYKELFGDDPKVTAIHAGLECGLIGERVGDMDMVSFGPRIVGAHSPNERVYVASVQKIWKYLQAVLAEPARA